jgi:ComF family protein
MLARAIAIEFRPDMMSATKADPRIDDFAVEDFQAVNGDSVKTAGWFSRGVYALGGRWRRALPKAGKAVADLIYPPRCVWCQIDLTPDVNYKKQIAFCLDCRRSLAPPVGSWCLHCGAPADGLAVQVDGCGHCNRAEFPWNRMVALGRYGGELSQAVLRTKRARNEPLTFALGRLLFKTHAEVLRNLQAEVVVPMPMHRLRRIRRGTNGPDLVAEALASCLNVPLRTSALKRSRLTPLQVTVNPSERHLHQRKSFRLGARRHIQQRCVLLVDDVLTIGATAAEAASTLLEGGARAVSVAALARGIGDDAL